jgi:hypothetical protein
MTLKFRSVVLCVCLVAVLVNVPSALCWSNGGYSADPLHPDYGTHDWIAQHALDYLPANEKQYLTDNLQVYLYGTELPDNAQVSDGIGDTTKHHVYYSASGVVTDDVSALRAQTEYSTALTDLKAGDNAAAAKAAGAMAHYISDVAVFGHVMGKSTAWGAEKHHSDYEDHVDDNTGSFQSTFASYLAYDGSLSSISAYNATLFVANNTVFGGASGEGCVWMDENYGWSNTAFSNRCGESLNLAVNAVADVLHTLYLEANPQATTSPTNAATTTPTKTPTPTSAPKNTATPILTPKPTPTPPVPEFPAAALLVLLCVAASAVIVKYQKGKCLIKAP